MIRKLYTIYQVQSDGKIEKCYTDFFHPISPQAFLNKYLNQNFKL